MAKNYSTGILITGDASGAQKAIKLTADELEKLNNKTKDVSVADWARKSASSMGSFAADTAKAASVAGVAVAGIAAAMVKSAVDSADATGILAGKLGVTTEALSRLEYAAKLSDVAQGSLEGGLKRLSKTLVDASDPASKAAKALSAIGLSASELTNMSADEQLGAIADALNRVESQSQKAALAQRIFGRAGVEMLPMLAEGSAGMRTLGDEAERLGVVISGETAARAGEFNDSLDRISAAAQGLGLSLAEKALPGMQGFASQLLDLAQNKEAIGGLSAIIEGIGWAAVRAVEGIGLLSAAFADLVTTSHAERLAEIGDELDALRRRRDMLGGILGGGGEERSKEMAAITARLRVLEEERRTLTAVAEAEREAGKARAQGAAAAGQAVSAGGAHVITSRQVSAALKTETDETKRLAESAQRERERHDDLVRSLAAEQASLRMTALDQARFAAQLKVGSTATDEQRREVDALVVANYELSESQRLAKEAMDAQAKAMDEAAKATDPWADTLLAARERVDSAFVDMWKNIGSGFDDFAASMKDGFEQLLAELAHLAITKPIVMRISGAMGLGGSTSAMAGEGGGMDLLSMGSSVMNLFKPGGFSGALSKLGSTFSGAYAGLYSQMGNIAELLGADSYAILSRAQGLSIQGGTAFQNIGQLGLNVGAGFAGSALGGAVFNGRDQATGGALSAVGGIIGSAWGPIGTFLGSLAGETLDRILGGSDFTGKRVKLGVMTGAYAGDDAENARTLDSGLKIANITRRADNLLTDQQITDYLGVFDTLDTALTAMSRGAGIAVDFANVALTGPTSPYDGGTTPANFFGSMAKGEFRDSLQDAPDDFVRAWIAEIDDQLSANVKTMLGDIGDKSAEWIVKRFGAALDLDKLMGLDVFDAVAKAAAEARKTALDAHEETSEALLDLIDEYDGSTESIVGLTAALSAQKETAAQLAAQYTALSESIAATFLDTRDQIEESLLNPEQLYSRRRSKMSGLTEDLAAAVDPAEIASLVEQINALTMTAYGMLDETQKAAKGGEFLTFLDDAERLAQERVDAGSGALHDQQTAINASIQTAMDAAALKQAEAAATQASAATQFAAAVAEFMALTGSLSEAIQSAIRETGYVPTGGYTLPAPEVN